MPDLPAGAGAAQLALLRRLEEDGAADDALVRLVLSTPATGRGRVDLPATAGDVPVGEVQRVAIGVLARLVEEHLVRAPIGSAPGAPAEPRPGRYWARRFRVHGSPGTADAARAALRRAGLVEGSYRTTHLVLALPLEVMVREHWVHAVAGGSGRPWRRLWRVLERRDRLPAGLDVVAVADRLAAAGKRVEVVVAPSSADAVEAAGTAFGRRSVLPVPGEPDPVGTDVRRRLNIVRAAPSPAGLVEEWCGLPPGPPLGVPAVGRGWLADRADRLAHRLADRQRAGNYPVHGDPAELARLLDGEVRRRIEPAEALAATVAGIRAGWRQEVD